MVAQLLFLEAEKPDAPISLYINSPGGGVTSGMAIYVRPLNPRSLRTQATHSLGRTRQGLIFTDGARKAELNI